MGTYLSHAMQKVESSSLFSRLHEKAPDSGVLRKGRRETTFVVDERD